VLLLVIHTEWNMDKFRTLHGRGNCIFYEDSNRINLGHFMEEAIAFFMKILIGLSFSTLAY